MISTISMLISMPIMSSIRPMPALLAAVNPRRAGSMARGTHVFFPICAVIST